MTYPDWPRKFSEIMKAVYNLVAHGFIEIVEEIYVKEVKDDVECRRIIYRLTPKGRDFVEKIYEKLPEDLKAKLTMLKWWNDLPIDEFLTLFYFKYPTFKAYSVVDKWPE